MTGPVGIESYVGPRSSGAAASVDLRIAAFNVFNGIGTDGTAKRNAQDAHVTRTAPDILVLNEVTDADPLAAFAAQHGYDHISVSGTEALHSVILSKYTILSSERLPDPNSEYTRRPIYAEIDIGHDTKTVGVYAIHNESICGSQCGTTNTPTREFRRAIEWKRINADIASKLTANGDLAVVVVGDYNDDVVRPQDEQFTEEPVISGWSAGPDITYPVLYSLYPKRQVEVNGLKLVEAYNLDGDRATLWAGTPNSALTHPWHIDFISYRGMSLTGVETIDSEATQTGGITKYGSALATTDGRTASDHKMQVADFKVGAASLAPVSLYRPRVTGTADVNQVLTCSDGVWDGLPEPTFTYQWLRNGVAISGQTSNVYTTVAADVNKLVQPSVTATNSEGSATRTAEAVYIFDSSAFAPEDLAGMAVRFAAYDGANSIADGAFVGNWSDISGNSRDALQVLLSRKPVFRTSVKNGLPAVRFTPGQSLKTATFATAIPQPFTIFLLAQANGSGSIQFMDGNVEPQVIIGRTGGGLFYMFAGTVLSNGAADNDWHVFAGVFNGASSEFFIDGASVATGNAGSNSLAAVMLSRNNNGATLGLDGDILEAIVYSSALDSADITSVSTYLANLAAITLA